MRCDKAGKCSFSAPMVGVEAKSNSQQQKYTRRGSKWWCDVVIHSLCTKSSPARLLVSTLWTALSTRKHKADVRCANTFFGDVHNKMGLENVVNSKRRFKLSCCWLMLYVGASEVKSQRSIRPQHACTTLLRWNLFNYPPLSLGYIECFFANVKMLPSTILGFGKALHLRLTRRIFFCCSRKWLSWEEKIM